MADRKTKPPATRPRRSARPTSSASAARLHARVLPGRARRQLALASLEVFRIASRSRAPRSKMRSRPSRWRRPLRHDPDRELGGRPAGRHPSPAAERGAAHRRRALPARAPSADGAAERLVAHGQEGPVAHAGTRPCRNTLRELGVAPVPEADTAGSARMVSESRIRRWRRSLPRWRRRSTASSS